MARDSRDSNDQESPSGAMRRGEAAGTPAGPTPRTDAADSGTEAGEAERPHRAGGVGDGMRTGGSAGTGSGHDPTPAPPLPRRGDPDEGNHGIGGGPAGGTGP